MLLRYYTSISAYVTMQQKVYADISYILLIFHIAKWLEIAGTSISAYATILARGSDKKVYVADSFKGDTNVGTHLPLELLSASKCCHEYRCIHALFDVSKKLHSQNLS